MAKFVLGVLLVTSGIGVSPAAADHSLSVTHSPPSGVKAGTDVVLQFRVTGGCENREQVEPDVSVTTDYAPRADASAEVSHDCGPLESHLGYSNSQGKSEVIAAESLSDPDEGGGRTLIFRIPGADVTSGTLYYGLSVWQTHSKSSAGAYATFWGFGCHPPIVPIGGGGAAPAESETASASYSGTFEVPGSGSTTTKGAKPRR